MGSKSLGVWNLATCEYAYIKSSFWSRIIIRGQLERSHIACTACLVLVGGGRNSSCSNHNASYAEIVSFYIVIQQEQQHLLFFLDYSGLEGIDCTFHAIDMIAFFKIVILKIIVTYKKHFMQQMWDCSLKKLLWCVRNPETKVKFMAGL